VFSCADAADGPAAAFSPLVPQGGLLLPGAVPARPHWLVAARPAAGLAVLLDEQAPPFGAGERTRGVATLRAQSRCPFRGFAETRLGAEALERPIPGFDPRERGEMLHHALEHVWSVLRGSDGLALAPAARAGLLRIGVERAIARQCRRRDPGVRWQRREAERMAALLEQWLETEKLREPFEVLDLEQGAQTARHGGVEFAVRIDRIDRLADGARVLIDYKTGMAAADWRGDRPDNPQLPIYALLRPQGLVAVAYGRVNAAECSFVAEAARGGIFKPRGRPSPLEGMPDFAALVDLWSQRMDRIAAEFAAGTAAVAPTLRACSSCRLHALCRIPSALDQAEDPDG
jgi:RecB family exonuclease